MAPYTHDLAELLAQPEGQQLAFVRRGFRTDELAETLAALANAQGGTVLVGLSGRTRKVEGLADAEAAQLAALDAALACTPALVLPLPEPAEHAGATLLVLVVPAGLPHVYSVHGKYLRREGAANQPITPQALRKLLLERGETSWERLAPAGAALADLDQARLAAYVRRVGAAAESDPLGFLFRRGCLAQAPGGQPGDYVPTNAGLLLFGTHVERFFPQCEVTLVRYRGREMSDEFLREDIRDTLAETVRRAELWLSEHMRRGSRMIGLERQDWAQFPQGAVREALVNAVAHRDYTIRGEGIRIALFGDRMECYSPGRLPGHMTVQNIADERFSRNETLVQILSDFGLIERLGYGIDRMLRQMAAAGLPPPEFRETAAGFLVTLRGHGGDDRTDAAAVDTREWRRMGLNERQIAALVRLAEQRRISNSDLQELAPDVSPETLRRDLADLVERGLLLKIGEKRGAYYILK
ncbi:MAG: ATP-binding protein [Kouleothrix sp.]